MTALPKLVLELYKIEPLDGTNSERWSQKLLLYFEQLEIDYVLTTDLPDDGKITADADFTELSTSVVPKTSSIPLDDATKKKLEKDNKLIQSYILNNLANRLFDLFVNFKSTKLIWTKLEAKYGSDDPRKRKYVVEGMKMCKILQVNVLIEKFPPIWSNTETISSTRRNTSCCRN